MTSSLTSITDIIGDDLLTHESIRSNINTQKRAKIKPAESWLKTKKTNCEKTNLDIGEKLYEFMFTQIQSLIEVM